MPESGEMSICAKCGETIKSTGQYWYHLEGRKMHPADPKAFCGSPDSSSMAKSFIDFPKYRVFYKDLNKGIVPVRVIAFDRDRHVIILSGYDNTTPEDYEEADATEP